MCFNFHCYNLNQMLEVLQQQWVLTTCKNPLIKEIITFNLATKVSHSHNLHKFSINYMDLNLGFNIDASIFSGIKNKFPYF
jgi:hypothetical protein